MIAFHGIFGAYGFWLPNDPRGSWSKWVGSWDLYRYGPSTKVNATHSLAHLDHDHESRIAAKRALRFAPVRFSGEQARAIGIGIAWAIQTHEMDCYACAILPDHVHIVIRCLSMEPGQAIGKLKRFAGDELIAAGLHPFAKNTQSGNRPPLCFARRAWKVYLDTEDDVRRSIAYVINNPEKEGLSIQRWKFVEPPRVG
ncbi:MAG: hypothetical protein ACE37H_14670 [Phycisphaeraceae bacterium]